MQTIRLIEGKSLWPFGRQSFDGSTFGNSRFFFGYGPEPTDFLFVLDNLAQPVRFAKERAVFLAGEPRSVHQYATPFLHQFGTVVSTDETLSHPNLIVSYPALPWHVGIDQRNPRKYDKALTVRDLLQAPPKTKLCSVICSDKAFTPEHRRRLAFVEALRKSSFAKDIDFFGRGFTPMADKDEALRSYQYHIVLENSSFPRYWTEKLADAYLRGCFPIYYGAADASEYFQGIETIDIADVDTSIERVATVIYSDASTGRADAIAENKRRIIEEYNMLAVIDRLATRMSARLREPDSEVDRILPERQFLPQVGFLARVSRRARRQLGWWGSKW
jgi:hypothetical protein